VFASALLVQQLFDPAQRAAQGLRVGPGPAQRQHSLKLGSDGTRDGLQRFRCISLPRSPIGEVLERELRGPATRLIHKSKPVAARAII